ncbi:MBL fold metallo-hydrolase [Sorangium sp. So ce1036]|uniref:MBL fold metallo-hydrolase n=1 Tax=Sorangium sp. So ce1036 TaxID=3133328 RepID=UPI003F04554E
MIAEPFSPRSLAPGGVVRVQWLGTAGFAIEHAGTVVLIDPYLTRASLRRCLLDRLAPDAVAIARHAPRADAIIAGHTHFDHALDIPAIALRTGATVLGSRSAAALCRASGVPLARVRDVEPAPGGEPVVAEVGPFHLRFVPSAHSRLLLGRVPFPGDISDCDQIPLRAGRYRCGAVFAVEIRVAGRLLVHLGSAELVEANLARAEPDLLLLCVAGWTASRDFPERVARALSPRAVLFSHWDNFFLPLERPAVALPAMQGARLAERLARASRDVKLGVLPLLGEVWI